MPISAAIRAKLARTPGIGKKTLEALDLEFWCAENDVRVGGDGVMRHHCGRAVDACRQINGEWWCEIVEQSSHGDGPKGRHLDSMG